MCLESEVRDECPRHECLEREKLIRDQADQIRGMQARMDKLELKLMSKRGKIQLLKMQLSHAESIVLA